MNTKKKTIKSILGCTTACSAVLLSGVGIMNINNPNCNVYATGVDSISVDISNANFNSNTSSTYPFKPNNFTATASSADSKAITAGVVNLSNEKYETRFALAKRSSLDNYVLMIDSSKEDENGNVTAHNVEYGYQTSSTIKLDANSKYMFSVDVFTATDAGIASLRLYHSDGKEIYSSIDNINSYNTWTPYTFFVSTNNYEGLELKLGMYLNGAGTVLFDNISCSKLSDFGYNLQKDTATAGTYTEKSEVDNVIKTFTINDNNQLFDGNKETNLTCVEYELGKDSLTYTKESDGKNAVIIKNTEETYSQYETDEILTFAPNKLYKVSIDVKTKNITGTASLQLVRTDIDEDNKDYDAENQNKTINITTNSVSSNSSVTNDYKTYSFLIRSHSTTTLTYKLKFGLGLTDAKSTGEMYLNKIEVSAINNSTFNENIGSEATKIDYLKAYKGNENMLDNADFNAFEIEDYNSATPAKATDWEVSTGTGTQKYGVVNTLTFDKDLNSENFSNLSNPSQGKNNNVLMMYNASADTLSYKSASKSLEANSYHKFDIDVQTQNAPLTLALVTTKDENEVVLLEKTINTNSSWEKVCLYIHSGYQKLDVSLKLTLNTESYGYAYVDNARFDWKTNPEMPATTEQIAEEFKTASNSTLTGIVDLSNVFAGESNENFAKPNHFTLPSMNGVQSGTITFNSNYLDEVIDGETNLNIFNSVAGTEIDKKSLAIWTTDYVNYTMTSNVGFSLVKGSDSASAKYYKISVDVFTQNLQSESEDGYGAGIKLNGFDNTFTNIQSDNTWTTYTFYVKPNADTTTYLELSLGSEDALTKGSVFFTNLSFDDTITKEEYNAVKETNLIKVVKAEETKSEEEEDSTETTSKNNTSKTSWMFLIPGLLTAGAILIALVGFLARKIKWKNPFKKKSKTAYDRNKTVSVQYYSRKATTIREEKIRELTSDLDKINAERKQFEEQYKQDLTKLREMKIKRADTSEIVKLEKDMKKNQKLSANLGLTANRINEELSYIQTDAYLNSLIRKLSKETPKTVVDNSNED